MKRNFLIGIVVMAIMGVVTVNFGLNSSTNGLSDMSLANVEALAQNEDGGTSVGVCFMRVGPSGKLDQRRFCDPRTSVTMIYPCGDESLDFYADTNKDRCTN